MDLIATPNKAAIRKLVERHASSANLHVALCLCCRPASCASGDIKYKNVVNMIKNAAALTVELSKNRKVTFFMEYVANEIFLTTFQRYFPDASIVVLKKTGKEKRRRLYMALGFSLQSLQAEVDKRTQKAQGELGHLPFTFTIETRPTEVLGSLTPSSYCELLPFLPQNRSSLF